jgi:putative endonuclease
MARTPAHGLGRRGELAALVLLWLKGYRLRHRNWRGPRGELDLVMQRRGQVVFVEVKTRSSDSFGGARSAVDRDKQRRLTAAAAAYLSRFSLWDWPCRFDVVTVERSVRFPFWRLAHLRNAFRPDLGRRL